MARARYYDVTQFPDPETGLIHKVSTVVITVYEKGTTTLLGDVIYQADSGVDTWPNPRTITDGIVEFFLDVEQRVSIKFDATGSGYGIVTKDYEEVWPEPSLLRTSIRSIDGTAVMLYDEETPPRLIAPGLLSKYGGWDCEVDFGMTPGGNPTTNAGLWQDGVDLVASKGGGDIKVNHSFTLDPIDLNHGLFVLPTPQAPPINILGSPGRGQFRFVGDTGPFLSSGTVAADRMIRTCIQDLEIVHADPVDSGATIDIGEYIIGLTIERVRILNRGRPDGEFGVLPCEAALIGINTQQGIALRYSKIELRTDEEFLTVGQAIGLQHSGSAAVAGSELVGVGIDGCFNRSHGVKYHMSGSVDTPRFTDCLIKDHERAIVHNSNVGAVANLKADGCYLDGITGVAIFLEPVGPGSATTWNFSNTWISAFDGAFLASDANGGLLANINFYGGYFTNSLLTVVDLQGNFTGKLYGIGLFNVEILSSISNGTHYGIRSLSYQNALRVQNNLVQVASGAGGAAIFSTSGQSTKVDNNHWVGVNATQGFTVDADSSYSNNTFAAAIGT
jgi:hypothetical protein